MTGVDFAFYICGVVVRADHARHLPDTAHVMEHPEGRIVLRCRTETAIKPPARSAAA